MNMEELRDTSTNDNTVIFFKKLYRYCVTTNTMKSCYNPEQMLVLVDPLSVHLVVFFTTD